MSRRTPLQRRARQLGVAAVEFAVLLPLLIVLMTAPLFIGRVLWHYTVAQKAAHDAARYLATVPEAELRTPGMAPAAVAVARDIAAAELADLNLGPYPPGVTVLCDTAVCSGLALPTNVRVGIQVEMHDPFGYAGDGMLMTVDVQMRYMGTK
jgi:Flp pilus assembly protein TadG